MTVIFVGGVHGVGKSTCCAEVAKDAGCLHVTASEIIRRERADAIAASGKLVKDLDVNQGLLIRGFQSLRSGAGGASILLDGHFALRDSHGRIKPVAFDVFNALGIDQLVCVVDMPHSIAARLAQRDGHATVERHVADLQDAELQNARLVATALGKPFTLLRSGDIGGFKLLLPPI